MATTWQARTPYRGLPLTQRGLGTVIMDVATKARGLSSSLNAGIVGTTAARGLWGCLGAHDRRSIQRDPRRRTYIDCIYAHASAQG